jgi:hypothetical protein
MLENIYYILPGSTREDIDKFKKNLPTDGKYYPYLQQRNEIILCLLYLFD